MPLLRSIIGYGVCSRFGYYKKVAVNILGLSSASLTPSHTGINTSGFSCVENEPRKEPSPYFEPEDFLSQNSQGDCVTLSSYTHYVGPCPLGVLILS